MRDVLAGFTPASTAVRVRDYMSLAAGCLTLLALCVGLWGVHTWFSMNLPADVSALATAGAILILACLAGLVSFCITCVRRARLRAAKQRMSDALSGMLKSLENGVGQNIQENPAVSLMVAGIAGYVLADMVA